jgi:hypothetical protein
MTLLIGLPLTLRGIEYYSDGNLKLIQICNRPKVVQDSGFGMSVSKTMPLHPAVLLQLLVLDQRAIVGK